ncbi:ASH2 [Candida margitis]|uniref:ASH2 n=1 Tax=Candida margitis TaxID=1775924 RepID=UPI002225BA01|nr:ASH2 [Candida margitis]KAI5968972.1 ASH2 [Candida margitis]
MRQGFSEEPSIEPQVQAVQDGGSVTRLDETSLNNQQSQAVQKQHNVVIQPRLRPMPFKLQDIQAPALPVPTEVCTVNGVEYFQVEDLPVNRRGFKYKLCRPNPIFTSNYYSTTDLPPFQACVSLFDRSSGVLFSKDSMSVTQSQGWRSARSNVGIREGSYYFEFKILNVGENSHVRVGLARREASLEAPVGYDAYGYGVRDVDGQLMFISRRKNVCVKDGFTTGDVIGFLVELPPLKEHKRDIQAFADKKREEMSTEHKSKKRKPRWKHKSVEENEMFIAHDNIIRDQIPTKSKGALYYDQYEYTRTKTMDHLLNPITVFGEKAIIEMDDKTKNIPVIANSKIRVFKNGVEQDTSIDNLYSFLPTNIEEREDLNLEPNVQQSQNPGYRNTDDNTLGYYPMLSTFQNGAVGLNAGPDFEFPPSESVKPLSDRYQEQVIEEWYWDVLDEVEAQYLDSFDE